MRELARRAATLAATTTILAAPFAPAAAADAPAAVPLHGTWSDATAPTCSQVPVTGRWSINLRSDGTAVVGLTMFMDGKLHAAWGGAVFTWTATDDGYRLEGMGTTFTIDGSTVRFDIPKRYPGCD